MHDSRLNINRNLIFTIHSMKMRRGMFPGEHTYHNSQKSG